MNSWDAEDGEKKSPKSSRGDGQSRGPFFISLLRRASTEFNQYLHSTVDVAEPVKKGNVNNEVKDKKDGPCRTEEICCREVTSSTALKLKNDKSYIVTGCGNVIKDERGGNRKTTAGPHYKNAQKNKPFAELYQQTATGSSRNDQAGFLQHDSQNDLHPFGVRFIEKRIPIEHLRLEKLENPNGESIIEENLQRDIPLESVRNDSLLKQAEFSTYYSETRDGGLPAPIRNDNVSNNLFSTTREFSLAARTMSAEKIDKGISNKLTIADIVRERKTTKSNPCRADTCCIYGDAENPSAKSRIPDKKGDSDFSQNAISTLKKSTLTYGGEKIREESSDEYEHSFYSKGTGVAKKSPEMREQEISEEAIEAGHAEEDFASRKDLSLTSFLAENLIVDDYVPQKPNFSSSSSEDLHKTSIKEEEVVTQYVEYVDEEAGVPGRARYPQADVSVQCVSTLYPSNCNVRICQPECMKKNETPEISEASSVSSEDPDFLALLKGRYALSI